MVHPCTLASGNPGHGLKEGIEARLVGVRPGRPVGCAVDIDDIGADLPHRLIVDAEPLGHTHPHVVYYHVTALEQPMNYLPAGGRLQVQGHIPLAAVTSQYEHRDGMCAFAI